MIKMEAADKQIYSWSVMVLVLICFLLIGCGGGGSSDIGGSNPIQYPGDDGGSSQKDNLVITINKLEIVKNGIDSDSKTDLFSVDFDVDYSNSNFNFNVVNIYIIDSPTVDENEWDEEKYIGYGRNMYEYAANGTSIKETPLFTYNYDENHLSYDTGVTLRRESLENYGPNLYVLFVAWGQTVSYGDNGMTIDFNTFVEYEIVPLDLTTHK